MSKAVNIVFKWQINSSKFLYLVRPNFNYGSKSTWGFISNELTDNDEEAIKQCVLSLNEESYKNVFEYMRDEVLSKSEYGKYLSLFDYSCYYVNNDCSWMDNKTSAPKIKTIVTTSTRTVGEGEKAETTVDVKETDILNEHTININFDFAIPKGKDGANGERGVDGTNGENGKDGLDGNALIQKTVMIYHTCKTDTNGNVMKDERGQIIPPDTPTSNEGSWDKENNIVTPPHGWALYDSVQAPVFMSTKNFCGVSEIDDVEPWSAPVQITGADGVAGKDGDSIQFVFCRTNDDINGATFLTEEEIGGGETEPIFKKGDETYKFKDNALGVDATNPTEYYCMRTKIDGEWSAWKGPYLWSKYGENGQDGDSVEYIYLRTTTVLENPSEHNPTPSKYTDDTLYQQKEYKPEGWTDNPSGVSEEYPYEYVSLRRSTYVKDGNGVSKKQWGQYSNPSLWAKFGLNGVDGGPGKRGRIIYPAGEWKKETTYKVQNNTTPYVTIKNGETEEYYYLICENEDVIGVNPIDDVKNGGVYWEKMESFSAIYTDLLVAKYGTIGGAVFYDDNEGNKYMFSTDGKINLSISNNKFTYNKETIDIKNAYRFFLQDKNPENEGSFIDTYANEWSRKVISGEYLNEIKEKSVFVPNVLINFSRGDAWFGRGTTILRRDGSGHLSNGKILWTVDDDSTSKNESKFEINANFIVKNDNGKKVAEIGDLGYVDVIDSVYNEDGTHEDTTIQKKKVFECGKIVTDDGEEEDVKLKGEDADYIPFLKVAGDTINTKVLNLRNISLGSTQFMLNDRGVCLVKKSEIMGIIEHMHDYKNTIDKRLSSKKYFYIDDVIYSAMYNATMYDFTVQTFINALLRFNGKITNYIDNSDTSEQKNSDEVIVSSKNVYQCAGASFINSGTIYSNSPTIVSTKHILTKKIEGDEQTFYKDFDYGEEKKYFYTMYIPNYEKKDKIGTLNVKESDAKLLPIIFKNTFNFKDSFCLYDVDNKDFYLPLLCEQKQMGKKGDNTFNVSINDEEMLSKRIVYTLHTSLLNVDIKTDGITTSIRKEMSIPVNNNDRRLIDVDYSNCYDFEGGINENCIIKVNSVSDIKKDTNVEEGRVGETEKREEKESYTAIYDDGTIETSNLIAHSGTFSGSINAEGVFSGILDNAQGVIENVQIEKCTINSLEYFGKGVIRFEEDGRVDNALNEQYKVDKLSDYQRNYGGGYTYDKTFTLFDNTQNGIALQSGETLCIPIISSWGHRYTPRRKNKWKNVPGQSIFIEVKRDGKTIACTEEYEGIVKADGTEYTNIKTETVYSNAYETHRYENHVKSEAYTYKNKHVETENISIVIKVRCKVWLETNQGCDYAAISFKGYTNPTTHSIYITGDDNEDKLSDTINSSNIMVAKEVIKYPQMKITQDGIAFITKSGALVINAEGIYKQADDGKMTSIF